MGKAIPPMTSETVLTELREGGAYILRGLKQLASAALTDQAAGDYSWSVARWEAVWEYARRLDLLLRQIPEEQEPARIVELARRGAFERHADSISEASLRNPTTHQ